MDSKRERLFVFCSKGPLTGLHWNSQRREVAAK